MNSNWLILVPWLLSVVLTSFSQNQGNPFPEKVHFQPPGYVFAIVWTLLYLLLGVYLQSLVQTEKTSFLLFLFTANMILNYAWMSVVSGYGQVQAGIFMIAAMLCLSGLMFALDTHSVRRALLVPYMVWLLVAMLLNVELSRGSSTNVVTRVA